MSEELGFRTPAKEIEKLRERLEQVEGLSTGVIDALRLSMSVAIEIFSERASRNPKDTRKVKDAMVGRMKKMGISPTLMDILDDGFKAGCDEIEGLFNPSREG